MFQEIRNHYIFWLAVVLVIGGAVLGKIAYEQHLAIATADIESKAKDKRIAELNASIAAVQSADAAQQKAAQVVKSHIKTSSDAVQVIQQAVPAADPAKPQTFEAQKSDFTPAEQAKVPGSPSYVVQTQEAAVATAKTLVQCGANHSSLTSCQAEFADMSTELSLEHKQTEIWKTAAKGGSKTKRFLKFTACAAAAGGGAYFGSLWNKPEIAAAGAIGGATACQLLF